MKTHTGNVCGELSVCSCNKVFDEKTLHPLISVIDLLQHCGEERIKLDRYSVILRQHKQSANAYGCNYYDFSDSVVSFRQPGTAIHIDTAPQTAAGSLLVFHPDLMCCSYLGRHINDYRFFNYNEDEALHLSCSETRMVRHCIEDIGKELEWGVDKFSATLICNKIEMLLNYCCRFYMRQFITRHDADAALMADISSKTDEYMQSGRIAAEGMPCAGKLSKTMGMSEAYFNDMVRHETGKEFGEYAQLRRVEIAKRMIVSAQQTDDDVASALGYCSTGCFRQLFERLTGMTTDEYKK